MATVLSASEISTLHTELQRPVYAGMTAAQKEAYVNTPEPVANPNPQGQVPANLHVESMIMGISNTSWAKVFGHPAFDSSIRPLLEAPNPKSAAVITLLGKWAYMLFHAGYITQSEYDTLAAPNTGTTANAPTGTFNTTQPDPSWKSTVPGPSPKQRLFGDKYWTYPDGSSVNFVPLDDVVAAS